MRRLVTWFRRLVGLALVAWSTWVLIRELVTDCGCGDDTLVAADADTGELYGFQITPLTPSQRLAALERERAAFSL